MSLLTRLKKSRIKRKMRVRKRILAIDKPRLSVYRSLNQLYAQVIDDVNKKTLVSCSTLELPSAEKKDKDKTAQAYAIGAMLSKKAQEAGINQVVFDRGRFLFHGRIKAFAQAVVEGGVKI